MPAGNDSVVAVSTPVVADAVPPKQDVARRLLSNNSGGEGLIAQLSNNPFFTAGFGLAGLGAAAAFGRRGIRQGASLLRRRLLVDVEINIKDDSYQWFLYWMTLHQQAQLNASAAPAFTNLSRNVAEKPSFMELLLRKLTPGMRQLSIETATNALPNGTLQARFALVPGPGKHILRYKEAFIMVDRVREAKARDYTTGKPWETITLTTLYSQRHIFESLFLEAHALAVKSHEGKTVIYNSRGIEWAKFGNPRSKRPLDSVILDEGIKERVLADIQSFLGSHSWYHGRGIPYRRGYLLHGPPGTGKSSFIQALAGHLDYGIAILNLSERGLTDDRLNHLLTIIPARTLILLEDVDVAFANRRSPDADGYQGASVTFSGLLNALDGVASAEERIVFLTTNFVERLDEALIRPGRVDMTVRLGEATRYQVEELWERFYGEFDPEGISKGVFVEKLVNLNILGKSAGEGKRVSAPRSPTSTAALQGLFLYNKGDMEGAISMAAGLLGPNHQRQQLDPLVEAAGGVS